MAFRGRTFTLLAILIGSTLVASAADLSEQFETSIRPLLAKNCYACHTQAKLGGLTINSREGLLKGGKSGPAIVPGSPDKSLLIQAINYSHPSIKMPPTGQLSRGEIDLMIAWIKDGAFWPEPKAAIAPVPGGSYQITPQQRAFWSFQPVRKPTPPEVKNAASVRTPIDRFVLARLEE